MSDYCDTRNSLIFDQIRFDLEMGTINEAEAKEQFEDATGDAWEDYCRV